MLTDDNFSRGQKTLVICCEEGVEEYETAKNTTVVVLDEADEMNTKKMEALDKEYQPERVIIEYNSIWTIERLGSCMLPRKWEVVQIITTVDANTFDNYFTNRRQMLTDPMKVADLILVNRCQPGASKSPWRRQLKAVNPKTNIIFENTDGTSEDGVADEDLPYDMKSAVIEIKDEDYALWYRDMVEEMPKYNGKVVKFKGLVSRDKKMPDDAFAIGRHIMTCCEADIQYSAVVAVSPEAKNLANGCWKIITAKLNITKHRLYRKPGPVLTVISMEDATAPEQPVATFF